MPPYAALFCDTVIILRAAKYFSRARHFAARDYRRRPFDVRLLPRRLLSFAYDAVNRI